MSHERRFQSRSSLNIKAQISAREPGSTHNAHNIVETEVVIANLNGTGAFLLTSTPLTLAARINLKFALSITEIRNLKLLLSVDALRNLKEEHVCVEVTGIVIRREENGVGIIFDANHQFTPLKAPK